MKVLDLMTTEVATVGVDTALKEAARIMVRARVSGLPVTNDEGVLVGIITEGDFLHRELELERPRRPGLLDALLGGEKPSLADAETVGEAMHTPVVTIDADATLAEAARVMAAKEVKRLPVIDGDGVVIGIISRADVVAAFTRPDEVIEDEIREDVIRRILFVDPATVGVEVEEGKIRLTGKLGTRSECRLLEELCRRLDGVVSVESELEWKVDDTKLDERAGGPLAG